MSRITVTTKLNEEEYEQLKKVAEEKGMSLCGLIKGLCMEAIEGNEILDEIEQMCFQYGIRDIALVKNVRSMLGSGKIHVKDGKMMWNPEAMNEDYISIDDRIDLMDVSDREKDRLKRKIAESLNRMVGQDDLGNGAGV